MAVALANIDLGLARFAESEPNDRRTDLQKKKSLESTGTTLESNIASFDKGKGKLHVASWTYISVWWTKLIWPELGVFCQDSFCLPTRNVNLFHWIEVLMIFEYASDGDDLVSPLKSHECTAWDLKAVTALIWFSDHMRVIPVRLSGLYAVLAMFSSCHVDPASYSGVSEWKFHRYKSGDDGFMFE